MDYRSDSENENEYEDNKAYRIQSEVENIEENLKKMEDGVRILWEEVIMRYKQNISRAQILDELTEHDFFKFYDLMLNKNKAFIKMREYLEYLKNIE